MYMRLSKQTWEQIKNAYASGIGLREIARKMNVAQGTVLARAKREGWTQQIAAAKQAVASTQSNAITPLQSIAAVMQERENATVSAWRVSANVWSGMLRRCALTKF